MQQLLVLDSCKLQVCRDLPPAFSDIQTPVQIIAWQKALADHPDQVFSRYIVRGLTEGFRVGFQHEDCILREHPINMKIADPQVVTDYLRAERKANRVIVMSAEEVTALGVHSSPIGIIPKQRPGGYAPYEVSKLPESKI